MAVRELEKRERRRVKKAVLQGMVNDNIQREISFKCRSVVASPCMLFKPYNLKLGPLATAIIII